MALSKEDQELMAKLRNKYQDIDAADAKDAGWPATGLDSIKAADTLAHVHLCHVCQGSGVQTEVYQFRRLESTCGHCLGEGVLVDGHKQSKPLPLEEAKASSSKDSYAADAADAAAKHSTQQVISAQGTKSRRRAERELNKLQQKVEELAQEKGLLLAALESSSDLQKRQLQENLLAQLQQHIDSLQDMQKSRSVDMGSS